ncbi:MAG: hypothetical protein QOJ63_2357 [Solirubrobacteraceae bacterium]|nr:hypothetical protein [Solirubrobacteraceae bacterium]
MAAPAIAPGPRRRARGARAGPRRRARGARAGPRRRARGARARPALLAAITLVALAWPGEAAAGSVPPPRGWPTTVLLGMRDPEHGAAALRRETPLGARYHYLSGGVNTGRGWQTFAEGNGSFVGDYVADSSAHGFLTVFSYYMLQQSSPGDAESDERRKTIVNLASRATMTAYFEDLIAFFQRAAETGVDPVVLHVEPDMWGYAQRSAPGDDAAAIPAQVGSTGLHDLAGLPDDVRGLARAIVRLRDLYAPNVLLGYHVSVWGTGQDISISDPPDDAVDALALRSAAFYRSLGASFDMLFFEFADRDAGYREHVDGMGRLGWWDAEDLRRNQRYVGRVAGELELPAVMWQIPLGNTRMLAMDDTRGHYQDNRVQILLDPSLEEMQRYRDAGVVALLFGHAVDGATCACDETGDGVTNPPPIDANDTPSFSADDDGGFFKHALRQLAQAPLPATRQAPAALASWGPAVTAPAAGDADLPPARPESAPRFSLRVSALPRRVRRGRLVRVTVRVTSTSTRRATVVVAIRGASDARGRPRRLSATRSFERGRKRSFTLSWHVPKRARPGTRGVVAQVVERRAGARPARRTATITVRR